jgi:hypothetical protein
VTQLASLNAHTSAIVDLLNAHIKTFDAGAPDLDVTPGVVAPGTKGWGWQGTPGTAAFLPYRIVWPLTGGIFYGEDLGTLGTPSDDASLTWQVTCVGATRAQCEWVVDNTHSLLIEQQADLVIPGRFVMRVWADMAGGGARRDDEVQHPVFIATPRYRVESTPLAPGGS